MNIRHLLHYSFHDARNAMVMGTSAASLARARERAFVKAVASQLAEFFSAEDFRVFSAYGRGNRNDFGTEQLLFDIEVCRVACDTATNRKKEQFAYIRAAIWQIEIEFSHEWRDAIYALNRLACGGAENKLLITAQRKSSSDDFLATMLPPASACAGQVYLALITQPVDWGDDEGSLDVWQLDENDAWTEAG